MGEKILGRVKEIFILEDDITKIGFKVEVKSIRDDVYE